MSNSSGFPVWPGWKTARLIGRGSHGAVYEICREHYGHRENAAMKVISIPRDSSEIDSLIDEGFDEKSITARFSCYLQECMEEYSMMADMKGCSNIVYCDDVREVQHSDGIGWDIFIRMELLTALSKNLAPTFSDEQVIKAGSDLCSALVFCEKRHILHRDIKPQNVFMAPDGTCKLGDFGISKVAEATTRGTMAGTPNYMAPEVYGNQPYGSKADQYSLGLVLYWMLNEQRLPFVSLPPTVPTVSEERRARERRFSGEPLPPPAHGSEALKRIVLKACAFDPTDRFESAGQMRDALIRAGVKMPAADPPDVPIAHGKCGHSCTWSLSSDGVLTVEGSGPMGKYRYYSSGEAVGEAVDSPWFGYKNLIKKAVVKEGVTSIGDWAFCSCANLTGIEIAQSVKSIGSVAFYECAGLTAISIPAGVAGIGDWTFSFCTSLTSVKIPSSVKRIGEHAFQSCTSLESIAIPPSVKSIGKQAFQECGALTGAAIPFGVTSIEYAAFYKCAGLTGVTIPSSVTDIGGWAFGGCVSLTGVVLPSSVKSIGRDAFYDCTGLTGISIPEGVTAIEPWTFHGCTRLTGAAIPSSVTDIGEHAFQFCVNLKDVYYSGSGAQWAAIRVCSENDPLAKAAIHFNS